jgi:hypothetical protein
MTDIYLALRALLWVWVPIGMAVMVVGLAQNVQIIGR